MFLTFISYKIIDTINFFIRLFIDLLLWKWLQKISTYNETGNRAINTYLSSRVFRNYQFICNINQILFNKTLHPQKKLFKFAKLKKKKRMSISDVDIKTTMHSKCFPLYNVKIWLLSLDYSLSGSYPHKTVFSMFYICKTNTSNAGVTLTHKQRMVYEGGRRSKINLMLNTRENR